MFIAEGAIRAKSGSSWSLPYVARVDGTDEIQVFKRTYMKAKRVRSCVDRGPYGDKREIGRWWPLPLPDGLYECRGPAVGDVRRRVAYLLSKSGIVTVLDRESALDYMESQGFKRPSKRRQIPRDRVIMATQAQRMGREDLADAMISRYKTRRSAS